MRFGPRRLHTNTDNIDCPTLTVFFPLCIIFLLFFSRSKNPTSRNWPKSKLAEVEIGRSRKKKKKKLAEVEIGRTRKKKLAEVEIGRSRPRQSVCICQHLKNVSHCLLRLRVLVRWPPQPCQHIAWQSSWQQPSEHVTHDDAPHTVRLRKTVNHPHRMASMTSSGTLFWATMKLAGSAP